MIHLDKVEKTLAQEGSLSQLAHEIVSDLGVSGCPYWGTDELAQEQVQITWYRPELSVGERLVPFCR
jgi:hypothetical protein